MKKGLEVKCEVHEVKKIERWVAQHGGGKDDKTILKADFRHLIRSESLNEYHQRRSQVITRWSQAYVAYCMWYIWPEISKFVLWTVRGWNFPTTEASIVTSNQCEHINRLAAEQQNLIEVPVDTFFYNGWDIMKSILVEKARGMMRGASTRSCQSSRENLMLIVVKTCWGESALLHRTLKSYRNIDKRKT